MFKLNLKIALRNLWKYKGYTLINIGGLAIGLASCMLLLLYVVYEWGYDRQFSNYKNTHIVYTNNDTEGGKTSYAWTPGVLAPELKAKIPGVKYASHSSYPELHLIVNGANSYRSNAIFADADFLKILDYRFLNGNPNHVLSNINAVILTESMAKKLFGTEDPINKTVKLDNQDVLKVEAVIADVPRNSSIQFDYLMPWALFERRNEWIKDMHWQGMFCLTIVQTEKEPLSGTALEAIRQVYKKNNKESKNEAMLHPLSKWHLYGEFQNGKSVGGKITQVKLFFMLAVCILLIACVNFMNLSTARSQKRAKEVGIKKVIGSSRKMLVYQFMLESFLLTLFGLVIAFMLAELSIPYFNSILNTELLIVYSDWRFWTVLALLTLFTSIIAGSYPAFYLSSFEPVKVMKGLVKSGSSSLSVRKVLVVSQFVFAACLIICTVVIYQQISYIKNRPIGFNKNNLIEISMVGDLQGQGKLQLLKDRLLKSGTISSVSNFSRSINQMGHRAMNLGWPGKPSDKEVMFNYRYAGYDFVSTIGANLSSGRDFSKQFADYSNVLVNEAAVKAMGIKAPIGTIITWGDNTSTIIGVIKDFVVESPFEKALPMVVAYTDRNAAVLVARMNSDLNLTQSLTTVDTIVKSLNPSFPVERTFVDDNIEEKYHNEKLMGTVANWFGGFAIFISALGLLGLALFMAEQRSKEISIRKVLGANNLSILSLLNRDFLRLIVIANLIAFPLAFIIIGKWLSHYEYRVAISLLPFFGALLISVIISALTVSIQSIKVARKNPIDALKYE